MAESCNVLINLEPLQLGDTIVDWINIPLSLGFTTRNDVAILRCVVELDLPLLTYHGLLSVVSTLADNFRI